MPSLISKHHFIESGVSNAPSTRFMGMMNRTMPHKTLFTPFGRRIRARFYDLNYAITVAMDKIVTPRPHCKVEDWRDLYAALCKIKDEGCDE